AGDHPGHTRQPCARNAENVAVDVVRMKNPHALRTEPPHEAQRLSGRGRGLKRSEREPQDRNTRSGVPFLQGPALSETYHRQLEAIAVQTFRRPDRVQLRATDLQVVNAEDYTNDAPSPVPGCDPLSERHRASPGTLPEDDGGNGAQHDAEVLEHGTPLDVLEVVRQLAPHVIHGAVVMLVHLRPPRDPRRHSLALGIAI